MQTIIRYHGARGSVWSGNDTAVQQEEDRFDALVEANDQILEKAVSWHFSLLSE
jgi:hypothetical protein